MAFNPGPISYADDHFEDKTQESNSREEGITDHEGHLNDTGTDSSQTKSQLDEIINNLEAKKAALMLERNS